LKPPELVGATEAENASVRLIATEPEKPELEEKAAVGDASYVELKFLVKLTITV
jgi:hypothetical protein